MTCRPLKAPIVNQMVLPCVTEQQHATVGQNQVGYRNTESVLGRKSHSLGGLDAKVRDANITDAFGAVVGLERARSRRHVAGHARAEVAPLGVGAVAPLPADVRHILTLVVVWLSSKNPKTVSLQKENTV